MTVTKLNTIILLTGEAEAAAFGDMLRSINSDLNTIAAPDRPALDQACQALNPGTRLISFCSSVIVPKPYLDAIDCGSYNFHPGPPNYPGRYPSVFALYDEVDKFGVTLHVMSERVDEGPIIAAEWFVVPSHCDLETLDTLAFKELVSLFQRFANPPASDPTLLKAAQIRWSGKKRTKADCESLCRIDASTPPDETEKIKRACGIHLSSAS